MKRRALILIAATAFPLIAACSGHPHARTAHSPAPSATTAASASRAAAACSKLSAAAFPPAVYDSLVIAEANRITGGGIASKAQERAAKEHVAAEVRAACPEFAYLARQQQ